MEFKLLLLSIILAVLSGCITSQNTQSNEIIDNKILDLKPGETYNLFENLIIRFGQTGTEFSVPDVIFGKNYSLNEPENINYLPINNVIEIYNDGKLITIKKKACQTEKRFTDVPEIWVTGCQIEVTQKESQRPNINMTIISQTIAGSQDNVSIFRPNYTIKNNGIEINENPLLYLGFPDFFVQKYLEDVIIGGAPQVSGGKNYNLDFIIITNFGVSAIRYTPSELFNEVSKETIIGPATITIKPKKEIDTSASRFPKIFNSDFSFEIEMKFNKEEYESEPIIMKFSY